MYFIMDGSITSVNEKTELNQNVFTRLCNILWISDIS